MTQRRTPDEAASPTAGRLPIEAFYGSTDLRGCQIAPGGERLALLRPDAAGVTRLWIQEIPTAERRCLTHGASRILDQFSWTASGDGLLALQDADGDERFHLFWLPLGGDQGADLTPFPEARVGGFFTRPNRPTEVLVLLNRRDPALFDVHRIDLRSGDCSLVATNFGNVTKWIIDEDLRVRGACTRDPGGEGAILLRSEADAWSTLRRVPADEDFSPLGMTRDGTRLHAVSNAVGDTAALCHVDLRSGDVTRLVEREDADVTSVLLDPRTMQPQAVAFDRGRRAWVAIDEAVGASLSTLASAGLGDPDVIGQDTSGVRWIVRFVSDAASDRFYLFDRATASLGYLGSVRPALDAARLAPTRPVEIEARDGLRLPSYLTRAPGVDRPGPLVLHVHGGPWDRDTWGFHPNVHFLADRGISVLQVNYRGSIGFGRRFKNAAKGELARAMHHDLIDAVGWAVERGVADPKRVAIMGSSFGGYAALVGLSFTPSVFACGVALAAPSNLVSLIDGFPAYWRPFLANTWHAFLGDPARPEDREEMRARSPFFRVGEITAPLLLGHGKNDPRVSWSEAEQMVTALREAGKEVEFLLFDDEGHALARAENRLRFAAAAESFLARHLGVSPPA